MQKGYPLVFKEDMAARYTAGTESAATVRM